MMVDPERAAGHVEHRGTTYYFCSKGCVAKFTAEPEKFLSGRREPMSPAIQIGGLKRPTPPPARAPHAAATNALSTSPGRSACDP
jgi:Cu+-exporting ATPase